MLRWFERHWMLVIGLVLLGVILLSILAAGYISLIAFPLER